VSGVVRAAGGVVWRTSDKGRRDRSGPEGDLRSVDGREIVLVHRPKYDDWTLPKGKLLPGEDDRTAALREVEEETGLRCSIDRPIGSIQYRAAAGRTKTVQYFLMQPTEGSFEPTDEVDQMVWVAVDRAAERLTYDHDRDLLDTAVGAGIPISTEHGA
jgi:8-oxo-dGTP diphosphatase